MLRILLPHARGHRVWEVRKACVSGRFKRYTDQILDVDSDKLVLPDWQC